MIVKAYRELVGDDVQLTLVGSTLDGVVWLDTRQQPLDADVQAKVDELEAAEPMRLLREERNKKLAKTDYMALGDVTMSDAWTTYRQALRDITSQTPTDDALSNITFPTKPS